MDQSESKFYLGDLTSPHYYAHHFDAPTVEAKVAIFADRVHGWQFGVAEHAMKSDPKAGFAVISILFSYFEMIAKYMDGYTDRGASAAYFKRGLRSAYELIPVHPPITDEVLDRAYEDVRCGLYHGGFVRAGIFWANVGLALWEGNDGRLCVNPEALILLLRLHFSSYIAALLDPVNGQLRQNFERRFDADP